jgi:3-deoxy-manno-octulosonate cytidylyltransferase (CMP-KDO synthetase)
MKTAIIIPARYGSKRFPGKPLAKIAGKTMLERVLDIAKKAASSDKNITYTVTTEDERISDYCKEIDTPCIMTPDTCQTGSDRVLAAMHKLEDKPDAIINIQGDTPFTPVSVVEALIEALKQKPVPEVVTPVQHLSWKELDEMREAKKSSPFSGTTVIMDDKYRAVWFSKNIIPAIRKEEKLRSSVDLSPVWRHIGVYGYRSDILEKFCSLPQGHYEKLERLEQLRMLENSINVRCIPVELSAGILSGIDTPGDLERAEKLL